jgi:hypothetical protein
MALRNAQGQRGKYLTRELSRTRNPVEDMYAIVSKFQSAKIGVYGCIKDRFPSSFATAKPRFYVGKFDQRTKVTL